MAPTNTQETSSVKHFLCIKRKSVDIEISCRRRWAIYIIGVIETFLFGSCIFGWAQLVYVLKNEEIFSDLCQTENDTHFSPNSSRNEEQIIIQGCVEQDKRFAFIYTIASTAFSLPAFLMGLLLHYCGLAVARTLGSLMLGLGFLSLGYTTKDNTVWLYVSMILLAIGGNQLRMAGLQFCNLFPKYQSTALTIISGSFAASSALFMIFQIGQQFRLSLWTVSICLAGIAFLSLPATIIMPWDHIPYDTPDKTSRNIFTEKTQVSVLDSIFSVSFFTQIYWHSANLFVIIYFTIFFNSWISEISQTNEEAGYYSLLYSMSSFVCPFLSPFPGLLTDYLSKKGSKDRNPESQLQQKLRSPALPLAVILIISLIQTACLFFNHYIAIYFALVFVVILKPALLGIGLSYIRIRFPAEHFNQMIGIQGTVVALISTLQYPLFVWIQKDFLMAMICFICLLSLAFTHPLHLLSKSYLKKVSKKFLQESPKEQIPLAQPVL